METKEEKDDEVTIIVDGRHFVFSGRELADASDYFDAMFFISCMKESITRRVELKNVSSSVMEVISDFVQGKQPCLDWQNIFPITAAATMLQLKHLCEKCCEFLMEIVAPTNCLSIMNFADQQSLQNVHFKAERTSLWNILQVIETEEYLAQTFSELSSYLGNKFLNLEHKVDAIYAVLKWVWAARPTMRCSEKDLLTLLAIFDIDQVSCDVIIKNGEEICELGVEEIREKFQNVLETSSYCSRKPSFPRVLIIVGGDLLFHDNKLPNSKVSYLDNETNSLKTLTTIPFQEEKPACGVGYKCCVVGKDLYITGGEKNRGRNQWCCDVWRYDPFENVWDVPTELPGPRRHHSVCTDGESLFLIGGIGSYRMILDTTDVFNVNSGEWSKLPHLPRAEFSAASACDKNNIYVVKSIVQVYSKASNSWSLISPELPYNSKIHSLHLFRTRLVMVAEFVGKLFEYETKSGKSARVIAEFKKTCGSGCFLNGLFYMAGGSDMDESASVECCNMQNNVIETVAQFETALANHCCVALPFWSKLS